MRLKNKFQDEDFDGELVAVVCPNCHSFIRKGDVCCRKCKKLLIRQVFGGEE